MNYIGKVVLFVAVAMFTNSCSKAPKMETSSSNSTSTVVIEQPVQIQPDIGGFNKVYRIDTRYNAQGGRFVVVNVQSIKKFTQYKTNRGETLNNAIVIQNVPEVDDTEIWLKGAAYFILRDSNSNIDTDFDVSLQTNIGTDLTDIILLPKQSLEIYNSIIMGGFEVKDGTQEKIFSIDNTINPSASSGNAKDYTIVLTSQQNTEKSLSKNPLEKWRLEDSSIMANTKVEQEILKQLKSPSTAKFASFLKGEVDVRQRPNQIYDVISFVDSQNDFGATVRTNFMVKIQQVKQDVWEIKDLNLNP